MKHRPFYLLALIVMPLCFVQAQSNDESQGFFSTEKIRDIRITFKQKNWVDKLDSLRIHGDGLLLAKAEIDGKTYENVGVRYRGSKSYSIGSNRNPIFIKLNYINKSQHLDGLETIKLSNALRDPSMVREVLSYEIARKYMPAPRANFANLTINGQLNGLYVNVEPVDDEFLMRHFGSSDHTFVKATSAEGRSPEGCKQGIYASLEYEPDASCYLHNYEMISEGGWDDLMELTRVLNKQPDKVSTILNVDRTLWMLAFNNVLVNLNSYSGNNSQNYYLYKDDKGIFHPIIWDMNLSFGSYKNIGGGSDLTLKELQRMDPLLHADNPTKPLVSKILQNDICKKVYLSHLRTILYDNFVNGWYLKRAQELQRSINVAFYNDPNKIYSGEDFSKSLKSTVGKRSKIPGIAELMEVRTRFLRKHPEIAFIPPVVEEVKVLQREKFSNMTVTTFRIQAKVDKLPKRVKLYYRFDSMADFQETYMVDDGKNNDGEAGDKVFGVTVDPQGKHEAIEYYILAENASAASFDPPNYMFQPYSSNLKELN